MKILVLSGEVTHQRPMSYGLPHEWNVRSLEIVDSEYLALCEKYEEPKNVSLPETISFLKRAYQRALVEIQAQEYDTIVGIGYGAHVLSNMVTAHEWRGPSIFIFSEGSTRMHFSSRPPLDEIGFDTRPIKSAWVTIGDKAKNRNNRREKLEFERGIAAHVHIFEQSWEKVLYATGMLRSLIEITH